MTTTRKGSTRNTTAGGAQQVDAFLEALDHPLQDEIHLVRVILLGVDPAIQEAVKWNAPSFRTTEFFATINLRSRDVLQLVFHTGAKVKATAATGIDVPDPAGLLQWRAKDRCLVTLGIGDEVAANRAAFEAIVRAWLPWV